MKMSLPERDMDVFLYENARRYAYRVFKSFFLNPTKLKNIKKISRLLEHLTDKTLSVFPNDIYELCDKFLLSSKEKDNSPLNDLFIIAETITTCIPLVTYIRKYFDNYESVEKSTHFQYAFSVLINAFMQECDVDVKKFIGIAQQPEVIQRLDQFCCPDYRNNYLCSHMKCRPFTESILINFMMNAYTDLTILNHSDILKYIIIALAFPKRILKKDKSKKEFNIKKKYHVEELLLRLNGMDEYCKDYIIHNHLKNQSVISDDFYWLWDYDIFEHYYPKRLMDKINFVCVVIKYVLNFKFEIYDKFINLPLAFKDFSDRFIGQRVKRVKYSQLNFPWNSYVINDYYYFDYEMDQNYYLAKKNSKEMLMDMRLEKIVSEFIASKFCIKMNNRGTMEIVQRCNIYSIDDFFQNTNNNDNDVTEYMIKVNNNYNDWIFPTINDGKNGNKLIIFNLLKNNGLQFIIRCLVIVGLNLRTSLFDKRKFLGGGFIYNKFTDTICFSPINGCTAINKTPPKTFTSMVLGTNDYEISNGRLIFKNDSDDDEDVCAYNNPLQFIWGEIILHEREKQRDFILPDDEENLKDYFPFCFLNSRIIAKFLVRVLSVMADNIDILYDLRESARRRMIRDNNDASLKYKERRKMRLNKRIVGMLNASLDICNNSSSF